MEKEERNAIRARYDVAMKEGIPYEFAPQIATLLNAIPKLLDALENTGPEIVGLKIMAEQAIAERNAAEEKLQKLQKLQDKCDDLDGRYQTIRLMTEAITTKAGMEFAETFAQIMFDNRRLKEEWIAKLRLKGVKAAHPNDGWVDRTANTVTFSYPDFDDGVGLGDVIALGWPQRGSWRLVKVVEVLKRPIFWLEISGKYRAYRFEDIREEK